MWEALGLILSTANNNNNNQKKVIFFTAYKWQNIMCKLLVTVVSNLSDRPMIMARWIKVSDTKPVDLSLIPKIYMVEGKNGLLQIVLYEALIPIPPPTTTTNSLMSLRRA